MSISKMAQGRGNNDYPLTCTGGGRSLRYAHPFDESERLAHQASLSLVGVYYCDGHSNDPSPHVLVYHPLSHGVGKAFIACPSASLVALNCCKL